MKAKKFLLSLLNIFSVLVIVFAVVVLLCVVMTPKGEAPSFMGYTVMRVLTGSMEPEIPTDSLIVVRRTDPAEIQPGDVISFYSEDPSLRGMANTHRVTEVEKNGVGFVFHTKGDANVVEDQYGVHSENLIGKVVFTTTILGKIVRLLSNPLIYVPLILIPMAAIVITNLVKTVNLVRKISKEEEEKTREEIREILKKQRESENKG